MQPLQQWKVVLGVQGWAALVSKLLSIKRAPAACRQVE